MATTDANHQLTDSINRLVALFNRGRYAEGEALAKKLTKRFPQSGFGWKALGVVLLTQGRPAEALDPLRKAAELLPGDAEAHSSLGNTLREQGRLSEAEASYRRVLSISPDYAEGHGNLGNILRDQGRLSEAEASYRRVLSLKPDHAKAHNDLGNTLREQGRLSEAEASYRRALSIKPDYAEAHSNLGVTLRDQGKLPEAEASYRRALSIKPDYAEAHSNLGVTLREQGRLSEAEASYRRALSLKPDYAEGYANLGVTLREQGKLSEAEAGYRRALSIKPDYAEAHSNLGVTLRDQGRLSEAEASYRQALSIKPDYAEGYANLGNTLREQGGLAEAEASYRQALSIKPDSSEMHSNLLFNMNCTPGRHLSYCLEEARRYGQIAARKAEMRFSSWQCAPRPERLRVGIVSGDLNSHPVGYFLESVLAQIDPSRMELIAYPTDHRADELTARIKPYFSDWKPLAALSDKGAATLIHGDGIHVLLDCSGHTAKNRLPVFAWKPAPVQVSWLAYFATTGLAEMDYLLGDPYATPAGEDGHFTEEVWRLPETYQCLTPPDLPLKVGPLPALSSGSITFGSFNNLAKMSDAVVAVWARVLQAVPHSRLFLKTKLLKDPGVRDATRRRFAACGINPDRLILEGISQRAETLEAHNRVDVILGPFPYPGVTTSVEAFWMGVPVITRRGDSFLPHMGESVAHNAGLADWIAEDDDDYVAKALTYTADLGRLAALRSKLRGQVLASPLFDAPRFARHFEAALRAMWERSQSPGSRTEDDKARTSPSRGTRDIIKGETGKIEPTQGVTGAAILPTPAEKEIASTLHAQAILMERAGRTELAARQLELALELDRDNPEFLNDLGVLYYKGGHREKGLACLRKANGLQPDNPETLKNLGAMLLAAGRDKEAIDTYLNITDILPDDIEALIALGNVSVRHGQDLSASRFFERVLAIDPDNASAKAYLQSSRIADPGNDGQERP